MRAQFAYNFSLLGLLEYFCLLLRQLCFFLNSGKEKGWVVLRVYVKIDEELMDCWFEYGEVR